MFFTISATVIYQERISCHLMLFAEVFIYTEGSLWWPPHTSLVLFNVWFQCLFKYTVRNSYNKLRLVISPIIVKNFRIRNSDHIPRIVSKNTGYCTPCWNWIFALSIIKILQRYLHHACFSICKIGMSSFELV